MKGHREREETGWLAFAEVHRALVGYHGVVDAAWRAVLDLLHLVDQLRKGGRAQFRIEKVAYGANERSSYGSAAAKPGGGGDLRAQPDAQVACGGAKVLQDQGCCLHQRLLRIPLEGIGAAVVRKLNDDIVQ